MSDIFISYANQDQLRAQMLAEALERQGWSTFWDRTIPAGSTWREVIGNELDRARCVIVLWSKASISSKWVQEEADDAGRRGLLVPILIDAVLPPLGFRSVQAADLSNWNAAEPSAEFNRLLVDITALIAHHPEGTETESTAAGDRGQRPSGRGKHTARLVGIVAGLVLLAIGGTWYVQDARLEGQRQRRVALDAERRLADAATVEREAEEEAGRRTVKQEADAAARRRAEEKKAEEEAGRRAEEREAEEEARRRAEEQEAEEAAGRRAEEREAEEEARRRAEEREAEEEARRRADRSRKAESQIGLTRAERRDVQRGLRLHGYDVSNFDGIFGAMTRDAIRRWQEMAGAQPTGYFASKDEYARFRLMAREKAQAIPSRDMIPTRSFRIPRADIRIDGNQNDWRGIEPVYVDLENDQAPMADLPGTDLRAFYLASDGEFLYLAMTLYDGMPAPSRETMYFFVAIQRAFEIDLAGDKDAAAAFAQGRWHVWTNVRGPGGRPSRPATDYPAHYAASGPNFIEWKVPLRDVGNLNGRFVRAYIHAEGHPVSDGAVPGIELLLD